MSEYGNFGPILNAKFEKFCNSKGYEKNGFGFERFVNFVVFNSFQPNAFNDQELFELVCVGGDNDLGIDGLGILVNGRLIKGVQDIEDILNYSHKIKVDIVFVQSKKRNDGISKDFVNNFMFGVRDFLSEKIESPVNEAIQHYFNIKNYLFNIDVCERLEENPSIWTYFVAETDRKASDHVLAIVEKFKQDIIKMNCYKEPIVKFVDSNGLNKLYDLNENNYQVSISFDQLLALNLVENVEDSAILFCYADEYLKILGDEDNMIRKSLFEDNVRDFQGLSNINKEIKTTIINQPELFALLNNGITIVCDSFTSRNKIITIKNPQIINGCQTSHIIFASQTQADLAKLPLVIKIIATTKSDIVNNIVRAANRQNIVYEEAFETTKQFHKDLEEFFLSIKVGDEKIYYERRVKQYLNNNLVKPFQKFSVKIITQAYIGTFLEDVHQTPRHETILIKQYQGKIFEDIHSFYPYYTSTFAYYRLESLIKENKIKIDKLHNYRFHLILISKYVAFTDFIKNNNVLLNSDEFCKMFLDILKDKAKSAELFNKAIQIMQSAIDSWINELKRSKFSIKDNKDFTLHLLKILNSTILNIEEMSKPNGQINNVIYRNGRYFGFITFGSNSIYFDERSLDKNQKLDENLKKKKVRFDISIDNQGRSCAKNIELV